MSWQPSEYRLDHPTLHLAVWYGPITRAWYTRVQLWVEIDGVRVGESASERHWRSKLPDVTGDHRTAEAAMATVDAYVTALGPVEPVLVLLAHFHFDRSAHGTRRKEAA